MKYLCFAVVFLYAVFQHSAMAGEGHCFKKEQFKEGIEIVAEMIKNGEVSPVCEEFMKMDKDMDKEAMKEKMKEKLAKLKEMEPEKKTEVKKCMRDTWQAIIGKMKDPITQDCFEEMMKRCPFQNA